ncbi:MAG: 2-oxoacid:ferredoxin oxidoreductase subunit beta [Acidobacteria bacterium]|jgi:2-oxoglutarate ferredoxin oxidoreductase subunit beta|nr:2-oxoacid:ferredoxin oxidoreductase subunit beta [Acidobacteriota bacterium]MCU0254385.1 2-oxoacid:ferredoxin oxidoreductase subunit beta [Acidobacteriota bacterium]
MPADSPLTRKDFASDQEVRWCPGCGDYAILSAVQAVFAKLGFSRERVVIVSGIGCSSRFPYYMNTYGFHTLHGRAPGIATGIRLANPELAVWVVTGDGDALAIGANHFVHAIRRNVGVKILLFNNRIYGLTKGQYSPTSARGQRSPSTPLGSLDPPFNPLALALGAGATFVARSVDRFGAHLTETLEAAAAHRGTAFVEIYQNCNIFNDGAFGYLTDKEGRVENALYLAAGEPLRWGREGENGLALGPGGELVRVDAGTDPGSVLRHDPGAASPARAFALAQLDHPDFPVPLGVFRAVDRPTLEEEVARQVQAAREGAAADLGRLLAGPETWEVGAGAPPGVPGSDAPG